MRAPHAAATAAVLVAAVSLALRGRGGRDGGGGPGAADTATLERLIELGAEPGSGWVTGSVAAPMAVPRVRWSPDEPLRPWLGRLRVPVGFSRTPVDRWPARRWDMAAIERALPAAITPDLSPDSGTMIYRDDDKAARLEQQGLGTVAVTFTERGGLGLDFVPEQLPGGRVGLKLKGVAPGSQAAQFAELRPGMRLVSVTRSDGATAPMQAASGKALAQLAQAAMDENTRPLRATFSDGRPQVGNVTHVAQQTRTSDFFRAIRQAQPFVRFTAHVAWRVASGQWAVWEGGDALEHDLPNWQELTSGAGGLPSGLLDPADELAGLLPTAEELEPRQIAVWGGGAGVRTTAHYDPHDNCFAQLHGTKRFLISPPADFAHLQIYPTEHPHSRQAQVSYAQAPPAVRLLAADLKPGDLLWLPAHWLHEVEAVTETISVSVVTPSAETLLLEKLAEGGLASALPFLEESGGTEAWDGKRLGSALRVFIPALLRLLAPRLGEMDPVEIITRRMWSAAVREETGFDAAAQMACTEISPGDRSLVMEAAPRAAQRFAPIADDVLPIFVVSFLELLQQHVSALHPALGVGPHFLEQCVGSEAA